MAMAAILGDLLGLTLPGVWNWSLPGVPVRKASPAAFALMAAMRGERRGLGEDAMGEINSSLRVVTPQFNGFNGWFFKSIGVRGDSYPSPVVAGDAVI